MAETSQNGPENNVIGLTRSEVRNFINKIDRHSKRHDACWEWLGARGDSGYGTFVLYKPKLKRWKAHRLCYFLTYGEVDPAIQLHHICENRSYVNPAHLEPVTARQHTIERTLNSVSAICAAKTHCKNGHEFNEENTRYTKNGKRVCRICNKAWRNAKYKAFRDANPPPEKTHCIHGHPLSGCNLRLYKTKTGVGRGCRQCDLAHAKEYQRENYEQVILKKRVVRKARQGRTDFTEEERVALESLRGKSKFVPVDYVIPH